MGPSGETIDFPEDYYQGEYIKDIARHVLEKHGRNLPVEQLEVVCKSLAEEEIFDDIKKTLADLTARGVTISHPVSDQGWGLLASMKLPSGSELSIYQPRHPTAYDLEG